MERRGFVFTVVAFVLNWFLFCATVTVILEISCQPCWIHLYIPSKSLRSKLIRDVSKASSTLIEEWWINVHAFDLAGRPYLIVFLSPVPSRPAVPLRSVRFSFCIPCARNRPECHVEFTPSADTRPARGGSLCHRTSPWPQRQPPAR